MFRITELEDLLYADKSGSYRKQLVAMLDAETKRLQETVQQGCTTAQYRIYTRQLAAIEQTYPVVDTIWGIYHGSFPAMAAPSNLTGTNRNPRNTG